MCEGGSGSIVLNLTSRSGVLYVPIHVSRLSVGVGSVSGVVRPKDFVGLRRMFLGYRRPLFVGPA